jgi:hypothetical protein
MPYNQEMVLNGRIKNPYDAPNIGDLGFEGTCLFPQPRLPFTHVDWLKLIFLILTLGQVACSQASLSTEVGDQTIWDRAHSPCDVKYESFKETLAKALDEKTKELSQYTRATGRPHFYRYPLGPLTLLEPIPTIGPEKETDTYRSDDWKTLHERYLAIKDKPVNTDWRLLDRAVRSLLMDDRRRRLYPLYSLYTMETKTVLEQIYSGVVSCLAVPKCTLLSLTPEASHFLQNHEDYRSERLSNLKDHIEKDYQTYYGFHLNRSLKRVSQNELVLPLDPGPFECCTWFIGQVIETTWSSPKLHVKVHWEKSNVLNDIYKLTLDPAPDQRDYVTWNDQKVVFHSVEEERTIGHEIGHVLGFPDRYYTDFEESTCRYKTSINKTDIMSSGEHPTEDEFKELDLNYPWKG